MVAAAMPRENPKKRQRKRNKGAYMCKVLVVQFAGSSGLSIAVLEYLKTNTRYEEQDIREWYRWPHLCSIGQYERSLKYWPMC